MMRNLCWQAKGSREEVYDCMVKVIDDKKLIYFLDCTCWNFVNRRIYKSGICSDQKFYDMPCKHLRPVVEVLEKQGYKLKKPKKMVGTDKCTPELRRFLIERSGGLCEFHNCDLEGKEIHRKITKTNGGKYNKENCVLLCSAHHEAITYQKWQGSPGAKND